MITQDMPDGGPVYAETAPDRYIVEPWNALSSLVFLIPALYCIYLIRGNFRKYRFLSLACLLLILGGIGSTLYHAFRSSSFLLLMDVLPIQLLTLFTIIYFWTRIFNRKWKVLPVFALFIILKISSYQLLSGNESINISYLLNGIMLFLPIFIYLKNTQFRYAHLIVISTVFFIGSLIFRHLDPYSEEYLPMGTHFLWHIFSAAGSGYLGEYLFKMKKELEKEEYHPDKLN